MWAAIINSILGLWLMAAPAVLGYDGLPDHHDRIFGPIIATFAFIAIAPVTRGCRWANLPLGLWLAIAPFVLGFDAAAAMVNSVIVGLLTAIFSFVKGRVRRPYGGGWRALTRAKADPWTFTTDR